MKHLKLFENKSQYDTYSQSIEAILPNVSYVAEENLVYYNPYKSAGVDYSKEYLYFEALEDGMTVSFKRIDFSSESFLSNAINTLYYSTDKTTWKTLSPEDESTEPINAGEKIYFKGNCILDENDETNGIGNFVISKKYNVSGNIMSLLFGDDFVGETDLTGYNNVFAMLFMDINALISGTGSGYLMSAKNLILPATTLTYACYAMMFGDCAGLTTAPELPATTLADDCYSGMFGGCTNLTTTPELPATTLANNCYQNMFQNCTGLTTALELPATTLAKECYNGMFWGCTNLTTAPEVLPATTLTEYCYSHMFKDCTSLTTAPELPSTTLAKRCYSSMFDGCTSLNYIKMLATDISVSMCLYNWVSGVASTGTFVKNAAATWNVTGTSGIPEGWTVETV